MKFVYLMMILFAIKIYSQELDSSAFKTELNELTVIGSIRADENVPIAKKTLNLDYIENNSYSQEMPTFLSKTPSITSYSEAGNPIGYGYFRLRGIDQTRLNITFNGIPLNEPEDQGIYFNNFTDFNNSVESIQIQRGVGTSTNGVASYGGSINFKSISLSIPKAEIQFGGGSFNTARYSLEYGTGIIKNLSLYMRYSNLYSEGFRDNSSNDSKSFYLSGGMFLENDILTFTSFYGHQENQMAYLAASADDINKNPRVNYLSPDERDNFNHLFNTIQYSHQVSSNLSLTTSLYYIAVDGNYDVFLNPDMYNFKLNSKFFGVIANLNCNFNDVRLDFGIHANTYQRNHSAEIKPENIDLYLNYGNKYEYSAFSKISYDMNDITFYGDIQFRHVYFKYTPEKSYNISISPISWFFVNPKIGATYKLFSNTSLYMSVGLTQREPTRNDMFGGADDIDSNNINDVQDLSKVSPEKVIDVEAGLNYEQSNLQLQLNLFSMNFKNEIAAIGELSYIGLPLRENVDESFRNGIELDINYKLIKNFVLNNNTTYISSQIKTYKEYENVQPLITPTWIVNTTLSHRNGIIEPFLSMKYVSKSYLNNENTVILPPYTVWDFGLKLNYKEHTLDLRVNNVMDKQYYSGGYAIDDIAYYYVQAPLNFFVTLYIRIL